MKLTSESGANLDTLTMANEGEVTALNLGLSRQHEIRDFLDNDGLYIATVVPRNIDPSMDWRASSFGVSTQCHALPSGTCELKATNDTDSFGNVTAFKCTKEKAGFDLVGNMMYTTEQMYFFDDWHRDIKDQRPFHSVDTSSGVTLKMTDKVANLREKDAGTIFKNPWNLFSIITLIDGDTIEHITNHDEDELIWQMYNDYDYNMFMDCKTTGTSDTSLMVLECRLTFHSLESQLHTCQL